jgi:hypothetical protein
MKKLVRLAPEINEMNEEEKVLNMHNSMVSLLADLSLVGLPLIRH